MKINELAIRTYELLYFKSFNGIPLEQCDYDEVMEFIKELYNWLLEFVKRAMTAIAEAFKNILVNYRWNGKSWEMIK